MEQRLTDLVPYSGDTQVLLHWNNFSNPVSNSLQRMLSRMIEGDSWREGIRYSHLEEIFLSDLMDTPNVGELRRHQILEELREVFGAFESTGNAFFVSSDFDFDIELQPYPDSIDTAQTLEQVVDGILEAFNAYRPIDNRTLVILQSRLPAFQRQLRTLDEIGAEFSVTRERIRQIERKYADLQIEPAKKENKLLEIIVDNLESSVNEQTFLLVLAEGNLLGQEAISLKKLKAILQILGIESLLTRVERIETAWDSQILVINDLADLSQKYRNKLGLIDLAVFTSETNSSDSQAFEAIKSAYPRSILRGRLVLARTSRLDTMFENALGKQLLVFGNLDSETLLIGIERQASYRQAILLGSHSDQIALVKAVAGEEPSYEILRENTHEEPELNQTDVWFLEIFQEAPNGMMHRNEITAAAMRDGKNMSSVGVFLLFNPLIRPVGSAVLALANCITNREDIQRHANIAKALEDRTNIDFEFSGSSILLRITPNLNTLMAGVLFPNAELRVLIKDFVFDVTCECAEMNSTQKLRLRPPNFWTGFTAALKHMMVFHSFARGDDLLLRLDFDSKNAEIILPKIEH
jgi:hypothetical protein